MAPENNLKHLEFVEATVNRMSGTSFLLKGWSVTLVCALFALAAKDANNKYIVIVYVPILVCWVIDAYFLSQERMFRALFDHVRKLPDDTIDFSMDTSPFKTLKNSWGAAFFSGTLAFFYLSFVGLMLAVMYFITA
jgi:hypothetical protein